MSMVEMIAIGLLVLIYGGSGVAELPHWRKSTAQYERWGYPSWWALVTPALKVVAAALTVAPATRPYGVVLCLLVGLAALATVLRWRERAMRIPAVGVVALTCAAAAMLLL